MLLCWSKERDQLKCRCIGKYSSAGIKYTGETLRRRLWSAAVYGAVCLGQSKSVKQQKGSCHAAWPSQMMFFWAYSARCWILWTPACHPQEPRADNVPAGSDASLLWAVQIIFERIFRNHCLKIKLWLLIVIYVGKVEQIFVLFQSVISHVLIYTNKIAWGKSEGKNND